GLTGNFTLIRIMVTSSPSARAAQPAPVRPLPAERVAVPPARTRSSPHRPTGGRGAPHRWLRRDHSGGDGATRPTGRVRAGGVAVAARPGPAPGARRRGTHDAGRVPVVDPPRGSWRGRHRR